MRRGDDATEENQSLQTAQEEEACDVERDVPDIANELVERDGGEQNSEPPINKERFAEWLTPLLPLRSRSRLRDLWA